MIQEQCTYVCGAYEGYCGKAEYDRDDDLFHGEVVGVRDVVTFQGRTPGELQQAFRESVDDYLAFCASRGESPEKPFSGKFLTRIEPEVHRKLSMLADLAGKSLNQFVADCLARVSETAPVIRSAPTGATTLPNRTTQKKPAKATSHKSRKSRKQHRRSA